MTTNSAPLSAGERAMIRFLEDDTPPPLAVSIPQAAHLLSVSAGFIRKEIHAGNIPAVNMGKLWRIRVAALEQYLIQREFKKQGGRADK